MGQLCPVRIRAEHRPRLHSFERLGFVVLVGQAVCLNHCPQRRGCRNRVVPHGCLFTIMQYTPCCRMHIPPGHDFLHPALSLFWSNDFLASAWATCSVQLTLASPSQLV